MVALLWYDSLNARESAIRWVRRACDQRGLQLLDQTVALTRVRPIWGAQGLRLRRSYRFEFSEDGATRQRGHVILRGQRLEELSFGLPSQLADA